MSEVKNVQISKEYLAKIRGFTAIKPEEIFFYIPKAYRELPKELQPTFQLSPASGEEAAKLADLMSGEVSYEGKKATVTTKRGGFTAAACKLGVKGWTNYYDEKGNVIEYNNKDSLGNIPYKLLEELADAIVGRASLTEEEMLGLK